MYKRGVVRLFFVLALIVSGVVVPSYLPTPAAVASAACFSCPYKNQATGRCLDDSQQYGLRPFGCNGLDYQLFQITGGAAIINNHTGRCLDDSPQFHLRSFPCNGLQYQRWTVSSVGPNLVFINKYTNLAIDDSLQFGLRTFTVNFQTYQQFFPNTCC